MRTRRATVTLYSDADYYGGAEVYLSMLARHLDPDRFRLTALVPGDPPVERLEEELRRAGAEVWRHRRPGLSWRDALGRVRRELREIGGEILHVNLPSTYDAALSSVALAAKLAGYRRVVTTEHLPMIERKYRCFPAKILFSEAVDLILVPSCATRAYVVGRHHLPPEKTRVLPYGVEEPSPLDNGVAEELRERTATPRDAPLLGVVGRLTPRKGHRHLFRALAALRQRGRLGSWCLWVIGEGDERGALERVVRELELQGTVRFIGPRADAADLMPLLDLLVVPSLVETTPFVILEAMAAGRPIVASRIYGIPEMIEEEESGLLVDPGDEEALARALERMLADRRMRERFGARGRERYERLFSAEHMARLTEAVYLGIELGGER